MLAILLAVGALIGWGSGDIFAAKLTRRSGPAVTSLMVYLFGALLMLLFLPLGLGAQISMASIVLSIILGVLLAVSYVAFNEALRIGNPSVVGVISGSFVVLVVIFSIIWLGEKLTPGHLFFIAITVQGIALSSFNPHDVELHGLKLDLSIIFSLAAAIGWGICFTFIKIPIRQSGWYWPTLITIITGLVFMLPALRGHVKDVFNRRNLKLAGFSGVLTTGGTIGFNAGLSAGSAAVVAPIAGAYPILFVLLAVRVFKEPLSRNQVLGIVASLAGIVGLAIVSP